MNTLKRKTNSDLGVGEGIATDPGVRFVNHDGSFNVSRKHISSRYTFSFYHAVMQMSWPKFYTGILIIYFLVNCIYASLYYLDLAHGFPELNVANKTQAFIDLFFYSVQVITTLGSSPLTPQGNYTHTILAFEGMTGMLGFALIAGFVFARFSNPNYKILFSNNAVIGKYKNGIGFVFRIINAQKAELIDVNASVVLFILDSKGKRVFIDLPLERDTVFLFPLNWTIAHPITTSSPLWGMSKNDLIKSRAEFIVSIKATDKEISKTVYERSSYTAEEVIFGATFNHMVEHSANGSVFVDTYKINDFHPSEVVYNNKTTEQVRHTKSQSSINH